MMMQHDTNQAVTDLTRRSFLRTSSFATFAALMGGIPLRAAEGDAGAYDETKSSDAPPLNFGVIGCGQRGREILATLATMSNGPVVAICDVYAPFVKRAKRSAPKAATYTDYQELLKNADVKGVVVATPTHQHKDIVLAALKAGKHVYCEMPMAHTMEDARAIAQAVRACSKVNFQAGLTYRADPQRLNVLENIRQGAIGKPVMARAQWHKKTSLRRTSASPEQEKLMNWRLDKATSTGLMGEIGIHQLDMACLYLNAQPVSAVGFGNILHWSEDGRDVPDTVQAVIEYPKNIRLVFDITLANSYDSEYEVYYGTDSAVVVRENQAWMFKEVDAPLLGWEVYARKDAFYKETGVVMMANATKLVAQTKEGGELPPTEAPLYKSLEAFITNSGKYGDAVEDFVSTFGEDDKALREYLVQAMENKLHAADVRIGFEATVNAIKVNDAINTGQKIVFKPEWYQL
ncbi:MAG: Gfo/Idh/MocA family oxidoreductase [Verrucomicrobia bacterium]|nr:Gfo/Idh/MocA family oxidoreductase [Verrucomicrobiota bacterium]